MPTGVSWELLRVDARRTLAAQGVWLCLALAVPLGLCAYTILRPFDLRGAYHQLVQLAIWLAAWYTLLPLLYAVAAWLRPPRREADADLRHLPLSDLHFLLRRWIEIGLLPLTGLLLSLPAWLITLAYVDLPYGQQWAAQEWLWSSEGWFTNLWALRILWVSLSLAGGMLLSLGVVCWLDDSLPLGLLRIPVLLGLLAASYLACARLAAGYGLWTGAYGPLIMCYRQTRGYSLVAFLLPPLLLMLLLLLSGLLARGWRIGIMLLAGLGAGVVLLMPLLPYGDLLPLRERIDTRWGRDLRQGVAWSLGHVSAPKGVRLLFDSFRSNVLLAEGEAPLEPAWPDMEPDPNLSPEANARRGDAAYAQYQADMRTYEARVAKLPRLALWVGAGLWPGLSGLLTLAGLALGHARRRRLK